MDLRLYYLKIREAEASITEPFPVMVSKAGTGGTLGVATEVTRHIAAKMIVDGGADPATAVQIAVFRQQQADALQLAREAVQATTTQINVVNFEDLRKLPGLFLPEKG
jgi:hypothetical protein